MTDVRERVADLVARGEQRRAWGELARLVMERPTTATCHLVSDVLTLVDSEAAGLPALRVALLTNFTAQPLAPVLRARAVSSWLRLDVMAPDFDVWPQEIVDPHSGLRRFEPDVVAVDLSIETLCPTLVFDFLSLRPAEVSRLVEETGDFIAAALRSLRGWSNARLLLHAFARPVQPSLGIIDDREGGQRQAFERLNARVRAIAHEAGNAFVVDVERLIAEVGYRAWHDARMWAMAKIPYTPAAMHRIAEEHLRYMRAFTGRVRKVLVLDLDDTLWGGVLGERGAEGIDLGPSYPGQAFVGLQRAILDLHRRGVVLAVNSSNDADDALAAIDTHPSMVLRRDAFSAIRINWRDKAENIAELAEELGLGLDSFVFVDNSDVECARMRQAWPEVLTVQLTGEPASFAATVRGLGVFDSLSYSDEDRQRGALYKGEAQRSAMRQTLGSLDDYLTSLEMELRAEPVGARALTRVADLTQRTNQFNMTARRQTADELAARTAHDSEELYAFSLSDRFGDQGIIAFAALEGVGTPTVHIVDFLVSCRVLKRGVEHAIVAFLSERARERQANHLVARFRPTRRNASFAGFYASLGFVPQRASADAEQEFLWQLNTALAAPAHIRVVRRDRAAVINA